MQTHIRRTVAFAPQVISTAESAPTLVTDGVDTSNHETCTVIIGPLTAVTSYTLIVSYWNGTGWVPDPAETVTLATEYVRPFPVGAQQRIDVRVSAITGTSLTKTLSVG